MEKNNLEMLYLVSSFGGENIFELSKKIYNQFQITDINNKIYIKNELKNLEKNLETENQNLVLHNPKFEMNINNQTYVISLINRDLINKTYNQTSELIKNYERLDTILLNFNSKDKKKNYDYISNLNGICNVHLKQKNQNKYKLKIEKIIPLDYSLIA